MYKEQKFKKKNITDSELALLLSLCHNQESNRLNGFSVENTTDLIKESTECVVSKDGSVIFKLLDKDNGREPSSTYLLMMNNKVYTITTEDCWDYFEVEGIGYKHTYLNKTTNDKAELYSMAEIASEAMLTLTNGTQSLYFSRLEAPTLDAASSSFFIRNELINQKLLAKFSKLNRIGLMKNIWTAMKISAIPLFLFYLGNYFGIF